MNLPNVKWEWTVPNVLSLIRIALLPVFAVLYLASDTRPVLLWWAGALLVLSGLTDLFDGWIARRFNQISEVGKLLDPVADKLTQFTVLVCIATQHVELVSLAVICLIKEVAQAIGGFLLLQRGDVVRGALWFGKVSTVTFYSSMAAIVLFPDMPGWVLISLVVLVALTMLLAFFGYLKTFLGARHALPVNEEGTNHS